MNFNSYENSSDMWGFLKEKKTMLKADCSIIMDVWNNKID
jgi:hypothetical protein